jgi:hypothetical protein
MMVAGMHASRASDSCVNGGVEDGGVGSGNAQRLGQSRDRLAVKL